MLFFSNGLHEMEPVSSFLLVKLHDSWRFNNQENFMMIKVAQISLAWNSTFFPVRNTIEGFTVP